MMKLSMSFEIISRSRWGADQPLAKKSLERPCPYIRTVALTSVKPCYVMDECIGALKELQRSHMYDDKQPDIKPNFLIGDDGHVYEGRGFFTQPPEHPIAHFTGQYLEIAHIGGSDGPPSEDFTRAKQDLIEYAIKKKFLNEFHSVI